tara:strand:- start:78 stop:1061 length:984 start_codon:yes stop_codon:yes gene_type:complete
MLDITKLTRVKIVSPGSKFKETKVISIDKIYVPKDSTGQTLNRARKKYLNQDHINKLSVSLQNGIDYSKPCPIVIKNLQWRNGENFEYELICGAHRYSAMTAANIKEWIFDVYEIGVNDVAKDLAVSSLQIRENDHQPELASTADDLSNIVSYLISKKLIKNTEIDITDYLEANAKNLHHTTFKKVVLATVRKNGAYQDIRTFPAADLPGHIQKNSDYEIGGVYDDKRKKFGWSVLEGYEFEYFTNALRRFDETDKGSYFLMHTKAPTEKRNLKTRRISMTKSLEQLQRGIEKAYEYKEKHGEWPWSVEAFLGQDIKNKENNFLKKI